MQACPECRTVDGEGCGGLIGDHAVLSSSREEANRADGVCIGRDLDVIEALNRSRIGKIRENHRGAQIGIVDLHGQRRSGLCPDGSAFVGDGG